MSLHNQMTHLDRAVPLNSFRFNGSLSNIRLLYAESPGASEHLDLDEAVDLDLNLYQKCSYLTSRKNFRLIHIPILESAH